MQGWGDGYGLTAIVIAADRPPRTSWTTFTPARWGYTDSEVLAISQTDILGKYSLRSCSRDPAQPQLTGAPIFWPKKRGFGQKSGTYIQSWEPVKDKDRKKVSLCSAEMDSLIVHLVDTNSFYISPTEVDQAFRLSTEGSQRLQSVSETETTSFYFCTSHNEHYGAASIDIHPVSRDDKNPFYKPTLRYSLCCGEAPEGRFKEQFQAVYNTCIRPIQWNFHNDGYYGRGPLLRS